MRIILEPLFCPRIVNFVKIQNILIFYHFVIDFEKKGIIYVSKNNTKEQIADILTKYLYQVKFEKF